MKPANYGPTYACIYPGLAEITRKHGYALAAHGSMARDFDLVCIPWAEQVSQPDEVVKAITAAFSIHQIGEPGKKNHGRVAYTISLGFGECFIDLSFMSSVAQIGSSE